MSVDKQAPIRVGFYDIEKTIGKGNFAVVKLARHRLTKTEVAIKIIDKTQLQAADLRRAYREVRVLKKLIHPHIIRLYQVMETKNMLYIVTEYAPQGEVFEHIARHGRLPEPAARRLYWQVVSAVDYCHNRGVVHRDLKAENLLLDGEGNVKLADFGFSTWWSQDGSLLSTWCGSPPYAAPEVFEGRQYTGPEVDAWSLGVVLYVLVCGALPFDAASLPALRDRVLSARYRVPYFMSAECESLVRKMLVRDPSRRYTIEQVKRHRWMQVDGPPRLLPAEQFQRSSLQARKLTLSTDEVPAPGHSPANNTCHNHNKQYMDPGLAPDVPSEPNEQILRLMASLGIDSDRTRESLRQQSYDHHAAIYFLLLERLRQHRPGGHRFPGSSSSGPPPSAMRMLSNDSSTYRQRDRGTPRRPSTIAEQVYSNSSDMKRLLAEQQMMKIVPGPTNEVQPTVPMAQAQVPGSSRNQDHTFWKNNFRKEGASQCGPSQTSSVDEGVADMDSGWEPCAAHSASSVAPSNASSSAVRSRTDWKWPARGSTGSSIQISSDLSQGSGSLSSSGTTLSSWDSAWEPFKNDGGGLAAASLPSCTQSQSTASGERRSSITGPETPLSPGPCLSFTADRLWPSPPTHPSGSPTEFRLGRRASDGLVGRIAPFPCKLGEVARAGGIAGIATLGEKNRPSKSKDPPPESLSYEEGCVGDNNTFPESQLNLTSQCSPAKRPSLPDAWKLLPDINWSTATGKEGSSSINNEGSGSSSAHLYRQLMSLRLQRRTGVVDQPDLSNLSEARANARKSVLRQQSYKLAQQQPVLPPLPGSQQGILGLDFRSISQEESRLHAHEEEDEEDEEGSFDGNRSSIWPVNNDMVLGMLPVTMGDCKLTDSNSSMRLSPLLRSHFHSPSSSPIPFPSWEQSSANHLPQPSDIIPQRQERMDTSANNVN